MKIIIEGNSQDLSYEELCNKLTSIRKHEIIDININGLKFKGRVIHYAYKRVPSIDNWEVIAIKVTTIKEEIKDLCIGVNEDEI